MLGFVSATKLEKEFSMEWGVVFRRWSELEFVMASETEWVTQFGTQRPTESCHLSKIDAHFLNKT
jgi:hypothetical protein